MAKAKSKKTMERQAPYKVADSKTQKRKPVKGGKKAAETRAKARSKPPKADHPLAMRSSRPDINAEPTRASEPGQVLVFGSSDCGQLGLGDEILQRKKPYPLRVLDDEQIVDIAAGGLHNMALTADGRLFSWGCNDQRALGRDGDETTPAEIKLEANGKPVRFIKVACGDSVTVALTDHGVYSWGTYRSSEGLLGFNLHQEIQPVPKLVEGIYEEVVDIAVGADHVLALTKQGELLGWGNGQQHQLGRRIIERRKKNGLRPIKLGLKHVVKIGAGSYHSFAVTQDGQLYAWGLNNFHQCGVASDDGGDEPVVPLPTPITLLKDVRIQQVVGGEHHSLVLSDDGAVYAFGRSDSHQTGLPYTTLPEDVQALNTKREVAQREAKALGKPFDETLFTSHKKAISKPTRLPNCPAFVTVACGSNHNLGLTKDGDIYSWGYGDMLALGNGEEEDEETPTLVEGKRLEDAMVTRIAAGGQHSVLLVRPAN
ncbi:hypothetical protein H4R35_007052 [Dimargaris xerosporica]|nr:hypothetical protein H4R35_007052 [Dimargaris xerosporica]